MGIHIKTAAAGLVLTALGIGGISLVNERSSWHEGTATVQRVTKQCEMTATERHVVTKTTFSATIDCGDVEMFELIHSDKTWHSAAVYTGDLRVVRDGVATKAKMPLHASKDREPAKGDTFTVLQDPKDPSKVAMANDLANNPILAGALGAAGLFVSWLGFGMPGMRRRERAERLAETREVPVAAPAPAKVYAYADPPQPAYQPPITDYSRARAAESVVSTPRRVFGKRGA